MKTWNDYKEYVRTVDPETAKDIKETEEVAAIVTAMIEQRNALGLSQRELAAMCGLPQSSVVTFTFIFSSEIITAFFSTSYHPLNWHFSLPPIICFQ